MAPPEDGRPGNWRRSYPHYFHFAYVFVALVAFFVHRSTLSLESTNLPLASLQRSLNESCPFAEDKPDWLALSALFGLRPPVSVYGVGVWVDEATLVPVVHRTLDEVNKRASIPSSMTSSVTNDVVVRFVWLQRSRRDAFLGSLNGSSISRESDDTQKAVGELASTQQLGLPFLKHAFVPDLSKETDLHAISFFSLPARLLPRLNATEEPVKCFAVDKRQAYCILFTRGDPEGNQEGPKYMAEDVSRAVSAAIASLMARWMSVPSFHAEDLQKWHQQRERFGCYYASRSLGLLERTLREYSDIRVPEKVYETVHILKRHVYDHSHVLAARAADDLQFHPVLTPQLYVPWDHSLLSQVTILLPLMCNALVGIRLAVRAALNKRKVRRLAASQMVEDGAKSDDHVAPKKQQ